MLKKIDFYKFIFLILSLSFFSACFNFGTVGSEDDSNDSGAGGGQQTIIISVTMGAIDSAGGTPAIIGQSEAYPGYLLNLGAGFIYNSEQGLVPLSSGYIWTSSNESIATVNSSGQVSAISTGDVTITATDPEGNSFEKTISVVSEETANLLKTLVIDQIDGAYKIRKGDSVTVLSATGTYSDNTTSNSDVYWISSNETVMGVGLVSGQVNAIEDGTATIIAIKDMVLGSKSFTVLTDIESLNITNGASASIDYPNTLTLNTTILDYFSNTITPTITWETSDSNVLTVSNGVVTPVHGGTATVTASVIDPWSGDTVSDTINITVNIELVSISISGSASVDVGDTQDLDTLLTITGEYNDESTEDLSGLVDWSRTNDTGSASILTTGELEGMTGGNVNVSVTKDGITSNTLGVSINKIISSIVINGASNDVDKGSTLNLNATINYNDATSDTNVTNGVDWTSANTGIATVGLNTGIVTGIAAGTTNVTATKDGISQNYSITVNNPTPNSIMYIYKFGDLKEIRINNTTGGGNFNVITNDLGSINSTYVKIYNGTTYYKIEIYSASNPIFLLFNTGDTNINIDGSQEVHLNDGQTGTINSNWTSTIPSGEPGGQTWSAVN